MNQKFDVVVVGAGLAGLTASAYLSKYGYSVLLIEKSDKVGGLANSFIRDGFTFDSGIRAFENSGIILPMIKSLGLEIKFIKNPVCIGIGHKWVSLKTKPDIDNYALMLKDLFPAHQKEIESIMKEVKIVMQQMDVIYKIDNPLLLDKINDPKYIFKTFLPWLFSYQINIHKASKRNEPIEEHLLKISSNKSLNDVITQHFFTSTPAFFALSYFSLYLDYIYPLGGTGVLAEKTKQFFVSHGGEICLNSEVISIDNNQHTIKLKDGQTTTYQKLIWAADQRKLYQVLADKKIGKIEKMNRICENSRGGNSVLTLYIGLNIDSQQFLNKCGPHAFYTPSLEGLSSLKPWQNVSIENAYEWVKEYLLKTTYEISIPVLRDQSLAPKHKTGLIISTVFAYQVTKYFSDQNSYQQFKDYCADEIIRVIETNIMPGLKDKIELSFISTPLTIEKETGNFEGAITGWSFDNSIMPSENRFKKIRNSIKTPIKDVYQCGAWTFSPSGLPVSILTGKLAADKIKKDMRRKKL